MTIPLHPMLVHFPIALLFASVLFDVGSHVLKRDGLREGALWLLGLGLVGGIGSVITGGLAEHAAEKAGVAESLIETHEALAYVTLGIMAFLFLYRLLLRNRFSTMAFVLYLVVAMSGLAAVSATGHTGGNLVYEHSVGMKVALHKAHSIAEIAPED